MSIPPPPDVMARDIMAALLEVTLRLEWTRQPMFQRELYELLNEPRLGWARELFLRYRPPLWRGYLLSAAMAAYGVALITIGAVWGGILITVGAVIGAVLSYDVTRRARRRWMNAMHALLARWRAR